MKLKTVKKIKFIEYPAIIIHGSYSDRIEIYRKNKNIIIQAIIDNCGEEFKIPFADIKKLFKEKQG